MRIAIFAMAALLAAPVAAREWADAGGWEISEAGGDMCAMGLEYEGKGETLLLLALDTDGAVYLSASNYGWSTIPDHKYDLVYHLNGTAYSGGKSIGQATGARKGFMTAMQPDFLKHFAASTYLHIYGPGDVVIDKLKLDGSAAGLAQLRRCVAHLKAVADAEAREKARFSHIPDDPFASLPGQGETEPNGPRPRSPVPMLFSMDDYPQSAIRNNEQGIVGYRLIVGADGRVTDCTVTSSSGSAILDSTTCNILRRRARFTPSKNGRGEPTTGKYEGRIRWELSAPEPVPPLATPSGN